LIRFRVLGQTVMFGNPRLGTRATPAKPTAALEPQCGGLSPVTRRRSTVTVDA
jgi:hypothetical protein